jgi:hypothetical protein
MCYCGINMCDHEVSVDSPELKSYLPPPRFPKLKGKYVDAKLLDCCDNCGHVRKFHDGVCLEGTEGECGYICDCRELWSQVRQSGRSGTPCGLSGGV